MVPAPPLSAPAAVGSPSPRPHIASVYRLGTVPTTASPWPATPVLLPSHPYPYSKKLYIGQSYRAFADLGPNNMINEIPAEGYSMVSRNYCQEVALYTTDM